MREFIPTATRWIIAIARQVFWCVGLLFACAVSTISAWFAWRYGRALGAAGIEGDIHGAAFAAVDLFKALMPALISGALARRRWLPALAGAAGFVALSVLSSWATFSIEVLERAALAAEREGGAQHLADLQARIDRAESRIVELGKPRPVATVDADIAAERQNWRWTSTKGCTAATGKDNRAYCATYNRLFGELAAAQEAANLRDRIDALQGEIDTARAAQAGTASRRQLIEQAVGSELQLIEKLFRISAEGAGLFRALAVAVAFELVGDFAITLVWVNRPGSRARRRQRGTWRRWLTWCKSKLMFVTPPAASPPMDRGGEGEVSPSPTPAPTGSARGASGAQGSSFTSPSDNTAQPTKDGIPAREGAPAPSARGGSRRGVEEGGSLNSRSNPSLERMKCPAMEGRVHITCPSDTGQEHVAPVGAAAAPWTPPSLRRQARPSDMASTHVRAFVDECLRFSKGAELAAAKLMALYASWCPQRDEDKFDWQIVARELTRLGFSKRKTRGVIIYRGLALAI